MSSIRASLRTQYDGPSSPEAPALALSSDEQCRLLETVERLADVMLPAMSLSSAIPGTLESRPNRIFMVFVPNDDNRKFTARYNVRRLTSPSFIGDYQADCSEPGWIEVAVPRSDESR